MSTLRIVVCLAPSAVLGLTVGGAIRVMTPNRPVLRAVACIALMPAVGWLGGKLTEFMVEETEGLL